MQFKVGVARNGSATERNSGISNPVHTSFVHSNCLFGMGLGTDFNWSKNPRWLLAVNVSCQ